MIAWTGGAPGVPVRTLHDIFEDAKRADCAYCAALAGEVCAFSGTGPDGLHIGKFAAAAKAGLISGADLITVLRTAVFFTVSTVVYDDPAAGLDPRVAARMWVAAIREAAEAQAGALGETPDGAR